LVPIGNRPLPVGDWIELRDQPECLRVRDLPVSGEILNCLPARARFQLLAGPVAGAGYLWWSTSAGGWIAETTSWTRSTAPVPSGRTPEQVVRAFYTFVAAGQFAEAYQLLAADLQRRQPYPRWLGGYETTRGVTIETIQPTTSLSVVSVSVLAIDDLPTGQVTRRFVGPIELARIGGEWLVTAARLTVVP
jgi:hypothetical protein